MKQIRQRLNERGEALQTAIITIIVSSVVLLGIASAITLVVQQQSTAKLQNSLSQESNNIDAVFRTDATKASVIIPKENSSETTSMEFHIPQAGSTYCDLVTWKIQKNAGDSTGTITRTLQTYSTTLPASADRDQVCNTSSPTLYPTAIEKTFSNDVILSTPKGNKELSLKAFNPAGREIISDPTKEYVGMFATNEAQPATQDYKTWSSLKVTNAVLTYTLGGKDSRAVLQTISKVSSQTGNIPVFSNASQWEQYDMAPQGVNITTGTIIAETTPYINAGTPLTLSWNKSDLQCSTDTSTGTQRELTYKISLFKSSDPTQKGLLYDSWVKTASDPRTLTKPTKTDENAYYTWEIYATCSRGVFADNSNTETVTQYAYRVPSTPTITISKTGWNQAKINWSAPSSQCAADGQLQYKISYVVKNGVENTQVLKDWSSDTTTELSNLTLNVAQKQQVKIETRCIYPSSNNFTTTSMSATDTKYLPITAPGISVSTWGDWNMGITVNSATCEAGSSPRYRLFQGYWNGGGNMGNGWAIPSDWNAKWTDWKTTPQSISMAWKWGSDSKYYASTACAADSELPADSGIPTWVENSEATNIRTSTAGFPGYGHWWNGQDYWGDTPNNGWRYIYASFSVDTPRGLVSDVHWAVWANGGSNPSSGERWQTDGEGRSWHGWVEPNGTSIYHCAGKWGDVRLRNPETGRDSGWVAI